MANSRPSGGYSAAEARDAARSAAQRGSAICLAFTTKSAPFSPACLTTMKSSYWTMRAQTKHRSSLASFAGAMGAGAICA